MEKDLSTRCMEIDPSPASCDITPSQASGATFIMRHIICPLNLVPRVAEVPC